MFNFFKANTPEPVNAGMAKRLEEAEAELALYKKAFATVSEVAVSAGKGNFEARIIDWDEYGDLSPALNDINHMLDMSDAFVREAGAALEHAVDGKYYRQFLPQGMMGAFGRGAEIINQARENMMIAEQTDTNRKNELAKSFEEAILTVVETIQAAVSQTRSAADALLASAQDTQDRSASVSGAASEAAMNVQTVASAVEEMSASVNEVARQVGTSSEQASTAHQEATSASSTINELRESSETIGKVVSLINDIAEQTNLLALNATIEAARAGEAGKGFAVVASEVKSLAQQTAAATGEIGQQVQSIQERTLTAVNAVEGISKSITSLNDISGMIASATSEQSSATMEISQNVQEAYQSTQLVSTDIQDVRETSESTINYANDLSGAAMSLDQSTKLLREQADSFMKAIMN
ncbi:methyl-accepting chemotaxis protein [Kordiimonas sp. SCSIO 12603]|uniref:methyl-accepting chemotaxis protein n=1 Tax=Kordiimonas sp. SCSIO 12603 TaxID=2829596 RepID=UPI00272D6D35|nr:methyl-accepting chemotaxis protein [Kordiimonas sp. SCSIO 12603]